MIIIFLEYKSLVLYQASTYSITHKTQLNKIQIIQISISVTRRSFKKIQLANRTVRNSILFA